MTDAALSLTGSMTAWRQSVYGGPEAVSSARIVVPSPRSEEVLVRVRATSLNAADVHLLRGEPLLLRLGFGLRRPRVAVRGMDVAATVVAVGAGVTDLAIGDEVMGELPFGGGLAEYAVCPAARLVRRPPGLDPVLAAALPLAGGTAWQALEAGSVRAAPEAQGTPQRVLVLGASGGVGCFAVQLAVLRGAEVWATCGARNEQLVASLGAARTFDYRVTDAAQLPPATFDAVIDIAGDAPLRTLTALLRPGGTLVLVSGDGSRLLGPMGRLVRGILLSAIGKGRRIRPLAAVAKPAVTSELAALAAAGRLRPAIERTFRFGEALEALAHIDAGRTAGKIVVEVADQG